MGMGRAAGVWRRAAEEALGSVRVEKEAVAQGEALTGAATGVAAAGVETGVAAEGVERAQSWVAAAWVERAQSWVAAGACGGQ